jgi:uncharacterized membrane protein YeaQ/YmgE (transglycosylase-associated protein family)
MNFIAWLVVGALIGSQAGLVMHVTSPTRTMLNIAVGALGAGLSGWLVSPLVFRPAGQNQGIFSFGALFTAVLGAIALLALVNLLLRGIVQ